MHRGESPENRYFQSIFATAAADTQPFFVQSCVPRIATGAIAPRALCPDGFMAIIGISQDVQTNFLPTSTVRVGPRPLACMNFVSVKDTKRASVHAATVRGSGVAGSLVAVLGALR